MKNFPRYTSRDSVTRPADTTAYAALDVLGAATTRVLEFTNIAPVGGGPIVILYASLLIESNAVPSGMGQTKIHLYSSAPTAIADNAAYDLAAGDRTKYLGSITLGTLVDLGSTVFVEDDLIRKQVIATGSSLFAITQTVNAFTPSSGTVKNWTLSSVEA
jgi:hypothetical protein